jgi:L-ascorbate metabolism protein UlaG (beta-lactamase superfamily)
MAKSWFICFVFTVTVLTTLAAQDQRTAEKSNQVVLKYLGTAGWGISDGTTTILIDPYLSRINGPPPPGGHSMPGDTRPAYGWGDIATPDVAAIDSHIQRADFVLVTHTHYDHVLDVPHIALKTGAAVIGTESTENVMRAYGVP